MIQLPLRSSKKKTGPAKIRKRSKKTIFTSLPRWIWVVLGGAPFIVLLLRYLNKSFFNNPDNLIKNVIISQESQTVYSNPDIHNDIAQYFSGVNLRAYSLTRQHDFTTYLQDRYPLISGVSLTRPEAPQTLFVRLEYHQPDILLSNADSKRIAYENMSYPIEAADTLQEGLIEFRLPDSLDQVSTLDGLFHHIHSDTLLKIMNNITDIVEGKDITDVEYLPGGQKLHITYKGKLILFHLDKSLDSQLAKLLDLKQYYNDFDAITRLDLGSNNDIIVK